MFTTGSGALRLNTRRERLKELCWPGSVASHPAGLLVPIHLYGGDKVQAPSRSAIMQSLLPFVGRALDFKHAHFYRLADFFFFFLDTDHTTYIYYIYIYIYIYILYIKYTCSHFFSRLHLVLCGWTRGGRDWTNTGFPGRFSCLPPCWAPCISMCLSWSHGCKHPAGEAHGWFLPLLPLVGRALDFHNKWFKPLSYYRYIYTDIYIYRYINILLLLLLFVFLHTPI